MRSNLDSAKSHKPKHIKSEDAHAQVHGRHLIGRFNAWLAVKITANVGTMYAAYLFVILGGTGVWAALTNNVGVVLIVGAISGYFLQLVLLPVIMVGQNVSQAASDLRADADHQTLTALAELNKTQLEILEELRKK
jgi:hypothetical protein